MPSDQEIVDWVDLLLTTSVPHEEVNVMDKANLQQMEIYCDVCGLTLWTRSCGLKQSYFDPCFGIRDD
jgi:hypothetical protein